MHCSIYENAQMFEGRFEVSFCKIVDELAG